MSEHQKVRNEVSRAYARAVTGKQSCCGDGTVTKGAAAALAGYTSEDLLAMPAGSAVSTFGCGNPMAFSAVGPGDVVLDLGSGAGMDLLLAAKKVGPTGQVIGVDMTDEMISRAEENIRAAGLDNVQVRKGIIEELPVESSSVDWIISNCVINLSPEKPRVFAELARVLKPGGQFLISDIVVEELPQWVRQSADMYNSCVGGAISEEDYLQGLCDAGIQELEVRDRLVYDAGQLGALVSSELSEGGTGCCGNTPDPEMVKAVLGDVVGKVWSAQIYGRKSV